MKVKLRCTKSELNGKYGNATAPDRYTHNFEGHGLTIMAWNCPVQFNVHDEITVDLPLEILHADKTPVPA